MSLLSPLPLPAEGDYVPLSMDWQFQPSSLAIQTMCLDISLKRDIILEDSETFHLNLTSVSQGVLLSSDAAVVTIIDDDSKRN